MTMVKTSRRLAAVVTTGLIVSVAAAVGLAADTETSPKVTLNVSRAGPRTVEAMTEHSILRDYIFAWENLAHTLEANAPDLLNGSFTGAAEAQLNESVINQRRSGVSSRYLNQSHKIDAVFYAPEGDLIELHDTAQFNLMIVDGNNKIYDQPVEAHYVVLMTPGADRWVVRQFQEVEHF
jgi:hypothetical protein